VIELYYQHAPLTCQNITLLALAKFYDNHPIHRVISNFMFQMGDPTGTGRGGQSAWGTPFRDEITRELKHVGAGVVSMANAGPNTNKSQVGRRAGAKRQYIAHQQHSARVGAKRQYTARRLVFSLIAYCPSKTHSARRYAPRPSRARFAHAP
jgi:hypothetical protein